MNQPIKLTIPSDARYLSLARKVLHHLLACHEVADDLARKLVLCLDEACSNVIKHSYQGEKQHPIEISFQLEDDDFTIQVRDYGKQCNIKHFKPRPLDEIKPGGLGTFFISEIMDDVNYCTNREKGTLLTMSKKLRAERTPLREKA